MVVRCQNEVAAQDDRCSHNRCGTAVVAMAALVEIIAKGNHAQVRIMNQCGTNSEFRHVSCHAEDQIDLLMLVRKHVGSADPNDRLHARASHAGLVQQQRL